MRNSWIWLGVIVLTVALLGGCASAKKTPPPEQPKQEEAAAPPPPPPPPAAAAEAAPPPAEEPQPVPPQEADIEPAYEEPAPVAQAEPPPPAVVQEEPPPPRALETTQPPAMAEEPPPPAEEYVAVVEAPPQPMAAAPDFAIVYFDFDKFNIKPEFEQAVRDNAQRLRDDSSLVVIVEGHCDERGTTEYNLALGERRSNAVRDALLSAGVNSNQLEMVSYGEERPVAMGHDEASWSQNRRAVLTVR